MTPEELFWEWFAANIRALGEIKTGREPIVSAMRRQLDHIDPNLMWEKGILDDGTHDFVISADGVSEVAPKVHRLADAAPELRGWRVTRFRPRREPDTMNREGFELTAQDVWIGFTSDPSLGPPHDIAVFLPGLTEGNLDGLGSAAMLMLDGWLGEEFVMTKLRNFTWKRDSPSRGPNLFPLTEAARVFQIE